MNEIQKQAHCIIMKRQEIIADVTRTINRIAAHVNAEKDYESSQRAHWRDILSGKIEVDEITLCYWQRTMGGIQQ